VYRWEVLSGLAEQRVFGIVSAADADTALATAEAMVAAGLRTVEIALTTPGGLGVIERLGRQPGITRWRRHGVGRRHRSDGGAGRRVLVSPSLHAEVISTAHRYGVAALPGAATPTWIAAGAVACGMGAGLTAGGPDAAAQRVRALLERVSTTRSSASG
jgi:2-dehydro-3-deoxyphosphogluconate aldolase / (4S)-4-hydroxy-2-oxoglutarate aldolase